MNDNTSVDVIKCCSCGETVKPAAKYCQKCGNVIIHKDVKKIAEKILCPSCGAENPIGAKFCRVDGSKLNNVVAGAQYVPQNMTKQVELANITDTNQRGHVNTSHTIEGNPRAVAVPLNKLLPTSRIFVNIMLAVVMLSLVSAAIYYGINRKKMNRLFPDISIAKLLPKNDKQTISTETLQLRINEALKQAGYGEFTADVNDDYDVILKGATDNINRKRKALIIVSKFENVKDIKDVIFVVK